MDYQEAIRYGPSRRDTVDRYVVGTQLYRQAARVFVDGGFRHGVNGTIIAAEGASDGANGDDTTAFPRHHTGGHRAAAENAGEQVTIEHGADVGQRDADAIVRMGPAAAADAGAAGADVAAGIGHQDVDGA